MATRVISMFGPDDYNFDRLARERRDALDHFLRRRLIFLSSATAPPSLVMTMRLFVV